MSGDTGTPGDRNRPISFKYAEYLNLAGFLRKSFAEVSKYKGCNNDVKNPGVKITSARDVRLGAQPRVGEVIHGAHSNHRR